MTWAAALFVVAAFVVLAKWFRVPAMAQAAFGSSRRAFGDLRDPALGEREKERAVQAHAGRLLLLFLGITLASAAAVLLPFGVVALLAAADMIDLDAVVQRAASPLFLLAAVPLAVGAALIPARRRP